MVAERKKLWIPSIWHQLKRDKSNFNNTKVSASCTIFKDFNKTIAKDGNFSRSNEFDQNCQKTFLLPKVFGIFCWHDEALTRYAIIMLSTLSLHKQFVSSLLYIDKLFCKYCSSIIQNSNFQLIFRLKTKLSLIPSTISHSWLKSLHIVSLLAKMNTDSNKSIFDAIYTTKIF